MRAAQELTRRVFAGALLLFSACEFPSRTERYACETTADCDSGRICDNGYCVKGVDASTPRSDGAVATSDAVTDGDTTPNLAAICPPAGYTLAAGPNGYYRTVTTGTSWTNARTACAADVPGSTHLVVLSTSAEVSYVATQVTGTQVAWIGLSDIATEGQFVTVTGETTDLRPWTAGEPNNTNGGEDCAAMRSTSQLDDRPCGTGYRYVCECDGRMSTQ